MTGDQGGDRQSLRLRPVDEDIILAVAAANARTVVAIVAAGAVLTETWRRQVPATALMWYAGMEGGNALAGILTGRDNRPGRPRRRQAIWSSECLVRVGPAANTRMAG